MAIVLNVVKSFKLQVKHKHHKQTQKLNILVLVCAHPHGVATGLARARTGGHGLHTHDDRVTRPERLDDTRLL